MSKTQNESDCGVKRYDFGKWGQRKEKKDGDYVKFTDWKTEREAKLAAQLELAEEVTAGQCLIDENASLKSKLKAAEKDIQSWKDHYYNDDEKGKKLSELEDHLDLMVDEFQRIKAIGNDEIQWICKRSVENTKQKVPMIIQRDNLESKLTNLRQIVEKKNNEFIYLKILLPKTNDSIDHILKERPHELYHLLCVDVPETIDQALQIKEGAE